MGFGRFEVFGLRFSVGVATGRILSAERQVYGTPAAPSAGV